MELLQLKYFCDAAETENFSKTAKKFLVPTSNISQSVKRLEKELGCALFEHKANKVTLNGDGRLFYADVSEALLLLARGKSRLAEKEECLHGDVRLVCLNNRRTVTRAMERFLQKHPEVNFIVHHSPEGASDFDLLVSDDCPYEYSKRVLLVDEEISVAMRGDHPLAEEEDFSVASLEHERFITMTEQSSIQRITVSACWEAGFVPNIAIQTDDPFYVRKYVEMGLGIAFVPANSWRGLFPESIVLKKAEQLRRRTYAYLPKRKETKRSVEAFLEMLTETAREE